MGTGHSVRCSSVVGVNLGGLPGRRRGRRITGGVVVWWWWERSSWVRSGSSAHEVLGVGVPPGRRSWILVRVAHLESVFVVDVAGVVGVGVGVEVGDVEEKEVVKDASTARG